MNTTSKNRFGKLCIGVTLSLALALPAGSMLLPTHSAYAASAATADQIIATGKQFLGVPYKFGAKSGNTNAFDCSSFTQYIFKQNGISIPRSSKQQSTVGTYVSRDQLQPGDLVFFYSPIHHVAVYMGNGKLLHTFGKGGVTITDLNSGSWNSNYTTARRVLQNDGQAAPVNSDSTNASETPDAGQVSAPDTSQDAPDQSMDSSLSEQNNQQSDNQQNDKQQNGSHNNNSQQHHYKKHSQHRHQNHQKETNE